MSLRELPPVMAFERPSGLSWDAPSDVLDKWSAGPQAAEADDAATISIYDVIGEDWDGGGWTARRVAGALRAIGKKDVTVAINSPGGDVFEGLAIYNLLREHPAAVHVKVMGMAASSASIVAMAGDTIAMGRGSLMMIHNAWGVVIGNRHDLRATADILEKIDGAMAGIYEARTGLDAKAIGKLMDDETYLAAAEAVEKGFADSISGDDPPASSNPAARADLSARRRLDALLAKQGVPRAERRRLVREASGTQNAAVFTATHDAGLSDPDLIAMIAKVTQTLTT